ncbi:DUF2059 domain-containing protein [Pseudoxanthomonas beigongshangi]
MTKRLITLRLVFLAGWMFFAGVALAAEPTDADIEKLLQASRAESMLNAIIPQMETMQRQQFDQLMAGKEMSPEQRAEADRIMAKTNEIMRKALSWQEMRPLYVDVYKKTFTREDVRAITKFYESPAGRSLLDKTPALMQNLMGAIQQKMVPMMEELQAEIQNVTPAAVPAPPVTPSQPRRKKKR